MTHENTISETQNLLLALGDRPLPPDLDRFCGRVVRSVDALHDAEAAQVYVCGDLCLWDGSVSGARIIRGASYHLEGVPAEAFVDLGQVPLLIHGVGVLFKRLFEPDDLFVRIQAEHEFQHLTESTKASMALRTGIYLTDVTQEVEEGREVLHHRLLRCSSNLTGPTDNLRETDQMIMGALNAVAREVFEQETSLNHVLAQVYANTRDDGERGRERKAKISAHSDKTKDMREDGLIAFCTFYDPEGFARLAPSESDPGDWRYKKSTGLTQLLFKLKPSVEDPDLVSEFSVTLYPNSVFLIPLSTNRLYTHAIRPSPLNVDRIPTRMGYVARSSKAEALFVDGQTFLKEDGALLPLEPMTHQTLAELRGSYRQENKTAEAVAYGDVRFSMNAGDYQKPIL